MGVSIWEGSKAERVAAALETVAAKLTTDKFTGGMKQALLDMFSKVAFIDDNGQDYIDTLSAAFYSDSGVKSISAVFTQPNADVTTATTLDSLKDNLVVTATLDDDTTETVDGEDYTITGTLTGGKSTLVVSYGGKTTTFDCLVVYSLAEAVVLDGSDNIDTGWAPTFADHITICGDVTLTGYHGGGSYDMIFSTYVSTAGDAYLGLNTRLTSGGAYEMWGCGFAYGDRSGNITGANERIRTVAVIDMTTGAITNHFKNVTNNVSKQKSNTYTLDNIRSAGRHIFIGHPDETGGTIYGMQGTVNSFEVYGRTLSSSEINAYLAGE